MRLAVIIPARNEARAIGRVIADIPREHLRQLIVVDNGSTDGTAAVAYASGATVVAEARPGYGRACLAGLAALEAQVETVVFLDGDYSDYPEDLPQLLAPIAEGRADLVIGSRTRHAQAGSLTPQQRWGNTLACALLRVFFGASYSDLGPFRAIRRRALARLEMQDTGFGWTVEMQAKAARHRLRIVEVPVRYRARIGRSKISGTLLGAWRAGVAILSTIIRIAWTPAREAPFDGRRRVLVFLKYPAAGHVKTRLAAALGDAAAAEVYRACVELTLEELTSLREETDVYVAPAHAVGACRDWLESVWRVLPQQGESLGARLAHATHTAFAEGAERVIAIGSDAPWLTAEAIAAAFEALSQHDVVLGPTEDGGYYLIGLRKPMPELFERVAWSTAAVFEQTHANARRSGASVQVLPRGYDIDTISDLERFLSDMHGKVAGPLAWMRKVVEQWRTA